MLKNSQVPALIVQKTDQAKLVDTWPDALPWEEMQPDWAHLQKVGTLLIVVDSFSGCMKAFICGDFLMEKVIPCLSAIFGRLGVPHILVSDIAKKPIKYLLFTGLQAQRWDKSEFPISNHRSNGLSEQAVRTVMKAMRAWNLSPCVSFQAVLQQVLFTHRNNTSVRRKTPLETMNGMKMGPTAFCHQLFHRTACCLSCWTSHCVFS